MYVHSCAVAERLVMRGRYNVELDAEVNVQVGPIYEYQLRRFQVRYNTETKSTL